MNFFQNIFEQLRDLWQRSSTSYRFTLVTLSGLAVAAIVAVGWWSSRPQFIPLSENLSPAEAAAIVSKLQAANIPHRLGFSASVVEVPKHQWNEAKLAAREVLPNAMVDVESSGSSILENPQSSRQRLLKEKERALQKTILQMNGIATASVHIALPEPSPFLRDRDEVKASVMLGLRRGASFTPEQAQTVAMTVAGAVEGLTVEHVTVTDQDGRILAAQGVTADAGYTHQFEYRRRVEADYAAKAEDVLAQMLGPGRAVVRVSADIDFTEMETVEQIYDPDSQVTLVETIETEKTSPAVRTASGPVGTAANSAPTPGITTGGTELTSDRESIDTQYAFGSTMDTTRKHGGDIKRLTVGVIVDLTPDEVSADPQAPALGKQDIEDVITQVVGLDDTRGDAISVVVSKINSPHATAIPPTTSVDQWQFYNDLLRNASLGIAALISLVLGILLIRKIKPIAIASQTTASSVDNSKLLSELSTQAQQNPELVSRIVSAWIGGADSEAPLDGNRSRKAAA